MKQMGNNTYIGLAAFWNGMQCNEANWCNTRTEIKPLYKMEWRSV